MNSITLNITCLFKSGRTRQLEHHVDTQYWKTLTDDKKESYCDGVCRYEGGRLVKFNQKRSPT